MARLDTRPSQSGHSVRAADTRDSASGLLSSSACADAQQQHKEIKTIQGMHVCLSRAELGRRLALRPPSPARFLLLMAYLVDPFTC